MDVLGSTTIPSQGGLNQLSSRYLAGLVSSGSHKHGRQNGNNKNDRHCQETLTKRHHHGLAIDSAGQIAEGQIKLHQEPQAFAKNRILYLLQEF